MYNTQYNYSSNSVHYYSYLRLRPPRSLKWVFRGVRERRRLRLRLRLRLRPLMCAWICLSIYLSIYVCKYIYIYIYIYVFCLVSFFFICLAVLLWLIVCGSGCICGPCYRTHVCLLFTYIYIYIYIHTYIYVYIYIYILI